MTSEVKTLSSDQIFSLAQEVIAKKEAISDLRNELDELTKNWNKHALSTLKDRVSEARVNLKAGDQVYYPFGMGEDYKVWQIREVEQVSDKNKNEYISIRFKPFTFPEGQAETDKEAARRLKLIVNLPKKVQQEESLVNKMIPYSVVGNPDSFKVILKALYPEHTNVLIVLS